MAKALAQFSIARTGRGFLIQFEDEEGESFELRVDADQIDEMIDTIEELLEADDDATGHGFIDEEDDDSDEED